MAEDTPPRSLLIRPRDLEEWRRMAALLAAVCYVVGLITVNLYLYELGISDFSLFRARFVLCGLVAMIPLALSSLSLAFFWYAVNMYRRTRDDTYFGRRLAAVYLALYGAAPLFWWIAWVSIANNQSLGESMSLWHIAIPYAIASWILGLCVVLSYLFIYIFAKRVRSLMTRDAKEAPRDIIIVKRRSQKSVFTRETTITLRDNPKKPIEVFRRAGPFLIALLLLLSTVTLILDLSLFARHVYPSIPEQLGGGKPREVRLLIAADAVQEARTLGIDISADDRLSPILEQLWETEDMYVVHPPAPNQSVVLRVDKSLVEAVVTGDLAPLAAAPAATPIGTRTSQAPPAPTPIASP
jgi:hypothetical protein